MIEVILHAEQDQQQLGFLLGTLCRQSCVIYLEGDLGAGKTTFARGIIRGLGHQGAVKSPTYAIVEPYDHLSLPCYHFDLYRLVDPEELDFLGLRDMLSEPAVLLFEWPDKGYGELPKADLLITIQHQNMARKLEIKDSTDLGHTLSNKLKEIL